MVDKQKRDHRRQVADLDKAHEEEMTKLKDKKWTSSNLVVFASFAVLITAIAMVYSDMAC